MLDHEWIKGAAADPDSYQGASSSDLSAVPREIGRDDGKYKQLLRKAALGAVAQNKLNQALEQARQQQGSIHDRSLEPDTESVGA